MELSLQEKRNEQIKCYKSFGYFASHYQYLFDQKKHLIPFTFNSAQTRIDLKIKQILADGQRVQLVILKPRKYPGISTYCLNRSHWKMKFRRGYKARHYLQGGKLITEFSERFRVIGEHLPSWLLTKGESYLTATARQPASYSHVFFDTAGPGATVPRGTDIKLLHISELDFYETAQVFLASALLAVGDAPDLEILVESTPMVYKGALFKLYFGAKNGLNNFFFIFIPWYSLPELRRPVKELLKYTTEEEKIVEAYGLDREQIAWRRWKIMDINTTGDEEEATAKFLTDFPEDDVTCFTAGKEGIFSKKTIERHKFCIANEKVVPRKIPGIEGRIYIEPQVGHKYILGADVSEGPDSEDADAAVVWDVHVGTQCAVLHGRWDIEIYTKYLNDLGRYFNNALAVVERNNMGIAVNLLLKNEYKYPRLYKEGKGRGSQVSEYGHFTSAMNKPIMIEQMKIALNKDLVIPYDIPFLDDCLFCRNLDEHTGDILMGGAIGNYLRPKAAQVLRFG